jgi:DNA-binding LytR/AlgR family response regulator
MKKLGCLVVDDEPLARRQLESYIERVPYLKLMGSARNATIASDMLCSLPIELIFLDIRMPGVNGIEFLKQSQLIQQVIIISAFPDYALEGFELEVTDYIMKPVSFERFSKACDKALARSEGIGLPAHMLQNKFLYVKSGHRLTKVIIADILYVKSMLNYVILVTVKERFIMYSSLKAMELLLPEEQFTKIHKSYLVAISVIELIDKNQVKIADEFLPVSRVNRARVLRLIMGRD